MSQYKLAGCVRILLIVLGLWALAGGGAPTHGSSGDKHGGNGDEHLSPTD